MSPHGAQRGKSFTLTLRGDDLAASAQIKTTLPASFSHLVSSKESVRPNSELPFLVELKPGVPVGLYPIRVVSNDGISNVVLFSVGDFPETDEIETESPKQLNDSFDRAQSVSIPVIVNGTLTAADIDLYSFTAKAGEKLVFEVEARRSGSAIDPAIEIFDAAGREISKNDDGPALGVDSRLQITFSKAGKYFVRLHDSRYSDQIQNFYRLKIGSYTYADGLFPLGWRRGETVEVSLTGGNLKEPVKVKPDLNVKTAFVPIHLPSSSNLPLFFVLSDRRETMEAESGAPSVLDPGTVMNGRIDRPGEIDRYRVTVEPGQKWVFELVAASLGTSQLDGILTLFDEKGKKLASRDNKNTVDPVLPFTVPAGVREVQVAVEDILGRGGPSFGYRLQASQQPPDFSAELLTPFVNVPRGGTVQIPVLVRRRGHLGPIRLRILDLPPGLKVAGGHIPQEAADQSFNTDNTGFRSARGTLTLTSDPDIKSQFVELSVVAEAGTPDGKIQRLVMGPGILTGIRGDRQKSFTAPWLEMQLPLGIAKALPLALDTPVPLVRISQGFEFPLEYRIRRNGTMKVPVKVNNQIAGGVGNLRILKSDKADKNPDAGNFLMATNFETPLTTFDMLLEGQAEIDGNPVAITAPAIAIDVVPGYEITLQTAKLEVDAGKPIEINGKIRREPTFEGGLVTIQAGDLPEDVTCGKVEVPANQKEFTIRCQASSAVKPGSYPIRITSTAPNTGRKAKEEYRIADLDAQLTVRAITNAKK